MKKYMRENQKPSSLFFPMIDIGGILPFIYLLSLSIISISCSSWIISEPFTLNLEVEGAHTAKIDVVSESSGENISRRADDNTLRESLKTTIDTAQQKSIIESAPEWRLFSIMRINRGFFSESKVTMMLCIAWCLADKGNNILYHDQFFVFKKESNQLFKTEGMHRTSAIECAVFRIARRALTFSVNPGSMNFCESDDPDTYDHFLEIKKENPELSVGTLDDIDWKSYFARYYMTE